jgi:hypothetical protein
VASSEIHSIQTVSGNQPRIRDIIEEAGQTFKAGTPVSIASGDGGVQAWNGSTIAYGIAGFSKVAGNNLTTTGVAQQITQGSVPNQSAAQNIQRPYFNDGTMMFEVAVADTIFLGQVGPSQSVTAANVGKQYGMTIDSDGHWYVDTTKTTVGTNTVAEIVKLDPNDQSASPRGVYFIVPAGNAQLVA